MMGIKQRNFRPLPRQVSLEELVPKDNFYRHLEATLDLSFVRELVRPLYAKGGPDHRSTRGSLLSLTIGDVLRGHPLGKTTHEGGCRAPFRPLVPRIRLARTAAGSL